MASLLAPPLAVLVMLHPLWALQTKSSTLYPKDTDVSPFWIKVKVRCQILIRAKFMYSSISSLSQALRAAHWSKG